MQRRTDRKHAKTVICVEEPLALELTYESSAADYVEAKQLAKLLIDSVAYSETLTETLVAASGCASHDEQQRVMNLSNSAARTRMRRIRENLTAATTK